MAGFNSPSLLFLNTWDKPERDWNYNVLRQALTHGYTRIVELYSGAFANLLVAKAAGWNPEQMEASDVWLYTSTLGYVYSGLNLNDLDVRVHDEPLKLSGDPVKDAALIITTQYRKRIQKHEDIDYMRQLLTDLDEYQSKHLDQMANRINENNELLHGLKFQRIDPMKHAEQILDDPHTIVFANPLTYKGAYEKFFDTDGIVTWNEPQHPVFDALTQNIKLRGMLESLPYCYQKDGKGQIQIISGHHRTRSALKAGIKSIPVIVDEHEMTKSTITAKQIAANELSGHADEKLLSQLIQQMDTVDDMLLSGLDQNNLPHPEAENISINSLNVDYDFKTVEFMFLGKEFKDLKDFIDDNSAPLIGLAPIELYEEFSRQIIEYANRNNIKNVAAAVSRLVEIAKRENERSDDES